MAVTDKTVAQIDELNGKIKSEIHNYGTAGIFKAHEYLKQMRNITEEALSCTTKANEKNFPAQQ